MDLYHPLILSINRNPRHFGPLTDASFDIEIYNPLCGDEYRLSVKLRNQVVELAKFTGYGCAVSKASTDILVEQILGKSLREAARIVQGFLQNFDSSTGLGNDELDALRVARDYPARMRCATLAWESCAKWLDQVGF